MNYIFENIDVKTYYLIFEYLLIFFIISGAFILRTLESKPKIFLINDRNLLIVFCIIITFLAGNRSLKIGTDTPNYYHFYYLRGIRIDGILNFFQYFQSDFLFEVIMYLTFPFKNFNFFLLVVAAVMNISLYSFVRKFTDYSKSGSSLILFLTLASSFIFLSHQINIIRNGLSIPFLLFGFYFMSQKKYKKVILFFIIAYLFHRTAILPIVCVVLANMLENTKPKYFIIAYVLAIGLAAVGFGFDKLAFLYSVNNEDFNSLMFEGETTYRVGFRPDFVAFNSFFLFLFFKFSDFKNSIDLLLVKYYILASIVFFLNFNIPFSDRIGAYSWIVVPLLLFNMIKNSFPNQKLYYSSLVLTCYFIINYYII